MAVHDTLSAASAAAPLILPAPAKLNLFLHILGRRPDGYHRLQTLFQLLDYGDELELCATPDGVIEVVVEPILPDVPMTANLAYRAALALRKYRPGPAGARILIRKRLPLGGGLGGGSSDAATVLVGLDRLWGLHLGLEELCELGLRLGADVPVFILGRSAWGEGIGEQLTPLELPAAWYLVLKPDCEVATAAVFAHPQLTRHTRAMKIRAFSGGEGTTNDCLSVVETMYPQVREARLWLARYAPPRLTGTGACLFARFDDEESARAALAEVPAAWSAFVAQGVNTSPLRQT
jgi:4-diphosphocytidyl-2-C-methyl-D-erythritol kinase